MTDPLPWRRAGFPRPGDLMRVGRALVAEPCYARLWRRERSWTALDRAGFLVDQIKPHSRHQLLSPTSAHVRLLSTPLPQAVNRAADQVVLVSTGSFAPLHEGHVAMFDLAEQALLDRGINVLASYLSPSHDGYVSSKPGAQAWPAWRRVHEARRAFEKTSGYGVDRLVDPWESQIATVPLNFTTVIARLQAYLERHLGQAVRVVYLFGADNAHFADVLQSEDHMPAGICIGRPGSVQRPPSASTWYLPASYGHASRHLRTKADPSVAPSPATQDYLLRNEEGFSFQHWTDVVPAGALQVAWHGFVKDLAGILMQAFDGAADRPASVRVIEIETQRNCVRSLARSHQVVNMDPCTQDLPGVIGASIARYFRPAHGQGNHIQHAPRPGDASIMEPHGLALAGSAHQAVVLVDDDSATGKSMDAVEHHLRQSGVGSITRRTLAPAEFFDIVDARDFLPGAFMAGLAVQMPSGQRARLPYAAPFVDLSTRALLPPRSCMGASIAIWRAATRFFDGLPVGLRVHHMHADQRAAFEHQGFKPDQALSAVCAVMADALEANAEPSPENAPALTSRVEGPRRAC